MRHKHRQSRSERTCSSALSSNAHSKRWSPVTYALSEIAIRGRRLTAALSMVSFTVLQLLLASSLQPLHELAAQDGIILRHIQNGPEFVD